jgi:predicted NBD/HSP70 family sugar kinase
MFTFLKESLADKLTQLIQLPVCIENDTRSMAFAELIKGQCKGLKDAIFVNVCWGIGIGIIIDGKLYYGKSGYSGEFGHMTAYNNNIICHLLGGWHRLDGVYLAVVALGGSCYGCQPQA